MTITDDCGAKELAQDIFNVLSEDVDFTLPTVDLETGFDLPSEDGNPLYGEVSTITINDLTTKDVDGEGVFDILMKSVNNHLKDEFRKNRITGEEYTKAYIETTTAALSTATQFLLAKDTTYYQAIIAQAQARSAEIEAVSAKVGLETLKAQLALSHYQALTAESEYALSKMKLATESADFCTKKAQADQITYQTENILPQQKLLLQEQAEVQRAQTQDTRFDGTTSVTGSIGKQKDLYSQQITSYKRDAEYKAGKMYLDAWITQKTLDEGLLAPDQLTNQNIDEVLAALRLNNNLGS